LQLSRLTTPSISALNCSSCGRKKYILKTGLPVKLKYVPYGVAVGIVTLSFSPLLQIFPCGKMMMTGKFAHECFNLKEQKHSKRKFPHMKARNFYDHFEHSFFNCIKKLQQLETLRKQVLIIFIFIQNDIIHVAFV